MHLRDANWLKHNLLIDNEVVLKLISCPRVAQNSVVTEFHGLTILENGAT